MRHIIIISLLFLTYLNSSAQTVVFKIIGNTYSTEEQSVIENNISSLLTQINSSFDSGDELNLKSLNLDDYAQASLDMLWQNVRFRTMENEIAERLLLKESDHTFQIRNIPVSMYVRGDPDNKETYQEAVIDINSDGRILSFQFGLETNLYRQVMKEGEQVQDLRMRQTILDYVEHFRTAYNQKDIAFLNQVFSDDALIITGRVIKIAPNDINLIPTEKIEYLTQSKNQYLSRLNSVFRRAKFIKISFSDIKVTKHPTKPAFYGVRVKQDYRSDFYSDEGYVFLLWDFTEETHPVIHVRSWQPCWMDDSQSNPLPEKDILDVNSFKL